MAESSDRHGKMIDAALRIYRPAMRRYITDTLKGALGDAWYEEWLEQRLDPQRDQPQLPKGARPRYTDNQRRVHELKLDPFWLIDVGDFPDIINTRQGDFPSDVRGLTGTMRTIDTIAKSSESRAPQQVNPILENCNAVLQAVDVDAAKQIQQLIKSGEPEKPWEAEVGTLPSDSDSEAVIKDVVDQLYHPAMQNYISYTLHQGHKDRTGSFNWFQELVLVNWPDNVRRVAEGELPNTPPNEVINVGNIWPTIRDNPQDFPEELSDGTYMYLFNRIKDARNDFVGHSARSRQVWQPRAERVARACVTILTLCERDLRERDLPADVATELVGDQIEMIRRIFSDKGEPQHSDSSPSPEIADDSPPVQDVGPISEDTHEPALLQGDDGPEQGEETRRREMDALSDRDPEAQSDLESAERERERRPFFGGALARLWASEAAQSGAGGGDGAFVADGEVDEREPVRDRRRQPVAGVILAAVILVGIAVAIGFAVPGLLSSDGESTPEPVTADPGGQTSQQELPAQTTQPAPEPDPPKNDPPVPPDDPNPDSSEPIEQGEAKLPPSPAPPPGVAISLSSGAGHSCRLTDDGAAACWGRNGQGQRDVLDGRFTAISAGSAHTCGLRESGAVVCWGWGEHNQLNWPSDKKFVSISAGHRHTCGITEQRDVVCWGSDEDGHDGQFSQVSAGYSHNCAITASGEVECWGSNSKGQLDAFDGRFTAISAGQDHTCGLRHGGDVECWGGGEAGEGPEGSFSAISAGQFHNCGILTSGAVRCWGDDDEGQLVDVPAGDDFVQIDAGAEHTCAVRTNGEIVCWGNTANGLDDVGSAAIGDHTWQGSDPQPTPAQCNFTPAEGECREPPRPECDFIDDEGKCQTDGEEGTSDSGSDGQNGVGAGDDDLESDSHQAEPPGDGTIDPASDAMEDDDGSGLQPGTFEEEEPGTTIVTAEDNPIIVIPAQESADGDVMEDDE